MRILYADKWQILHLDRLWIIGAFLPHCLFLLVSHSHLWISRIGWLTPLCCWSNPTCLSTNASERPNEAVLLKGNRAQTHNVKTSYCIYWDQCARQNRWPHKCIDTTETHKGQWQTRMFEKRKKKNILCEKVLVIFGSLLQGCEVVYHLVKNTFLATWRRRTLLNYQKGYWTSRRSVMNKLTPFGLNKTPFHFGGQNVWYWPRNIKTLTHTQWGTLLFFYPSKNNNYNYNNNDNNLKNNFDLEI